LVSGCQYCGYLNIEGKLRIDDENGDDDFVGIVFSFQNNTHFYLVDWKNKSKDEASIPGVNIKRVQSPKIPLEYGKTLNDALRSPYKVGLGKIVHQVWHDDENRPWVVGETYNFKIQHRPLTGLINVQISGGSVGLIDSGDVYDPEYKGGRFGVYDLSQRLATFWDVHYRCGFGAEHALEFDGVNAYVNLLVETALNQYSSFSLTVWVKAYTRTEPAIHPIVCSHRDRGLCLFVNIGRLKGRLGTVEVSDSRLFEFNKWVYVGLVYDFTAEKLRLYHSGVLVGEESLRTTEKSDNLLIGKYGHQLVFFYGQIDEVRLWSIPLTSAQIKEGTQSRSHTQESGHLIAYYPVDLGAGKVLKDRITNNLNGRLNGGTEWVHI
jgi:hypothetical protein